MVSAHDIIGNSPLVTEFQHKQEVRKEKFLVLKDSKTGGIPGLLPLVLDLLIRFTESIGQQAHDLGIFKHARGFLRGWSLPDEEIARSASMDDPEIVPIRRPTKLYIEPETATKHLPLIDGERIFELTVQSKPWTVDTEGNLKVTRLGFPIVPDFGGTAHAYCGSTMPAAFGRFIALAQKARKR